MCIHIAKLRRLLQIDDGGLHIFFCAGSGVEHLTEAVLQLIIMAVLLQLIKAGEGRTEVPGGKLRAHSRANAIPVHFRQLIICIGIVLRSR